MNKTIEAKELLRCLCGKTQEIALLDVRDVVPFASGHALWATQLCLDRLELEVPRLIPRAQTPVVVMAVNDADAALGQQRLQDLGFANVSVLEGGLSAWRLAGGVVHREIEVPSKAFGGFVENMGSLSFIDARELKQAQDNGVDIKIIDSRPRAEYQQGNIPGSVDLPGGEMLRCFDDVVTDPRTLVVVNCMSRTRGILGALSLVEAGVPNRVVNLRDGTRGWQLAGFELETGASRFGVNPSPSTLRLARERTRKLLERAGIPIVDVPSVQAWQADTQQTTYLFDLRAESEYLSGHLPGALSCPESKIVMNPSAYFATLNARIVLTDSDLVRAGIAALWLAQMGWGELAVVETDAAGDGLIGAEREQSQNWSSARQISTPSGLDPIPGLDPINVESWIRETGAKVVDVGCSANYNQAHIPGAVWSTRTALLSACDDGAFDSRALLLTCEDGRAGELAASDLLALGMLKVAFVAGGIEALRAHEFELTAHAPRFETARDDNFLTSSQRPGDVEQNVRAYLAWETELGDVVERSGESRFKNLLWRA